MIAAFETGAVMSNTTDKTDDATQYDEETDPYCIDDASARDLLRGAPWRRFGLIGDSIAEGVGDASPGYRSLHWPIRVQNSLDAAVGGLEYLNLARSWATSRQVLDDQLEAVLEFDPDLLFVACGGNDLMTTEPDYQDIESNLNQLFAAGASTGAQLITMTFADATTDPKMIRFRPRVERLNEIVRTVASRYNAALVEFWWHPVGKRPGILGADKIHMTTSGHAVIAAEVVKALSAVLVDRDAAGQQ
ncbi:SGNH/GDSL hydrolase family protein [Nocardia sp. CA-128927]|uniref:SGNH/GDSL hydrolase family protein n=1 Tax=Nocardia sp. CA-128927 TaxID=3239975 RepID=UPI003D96A472